MRKFVKVLRRKLRLRAIAFALLMLLNILAMPATSGTNSYGRYETSDSLVVLTAAQADSLLHLINRQEQQIKLLEIDLWEAKQLAYADSTFLANQTRLLTNYYEAMIADMNRETWFNKTVRHPMLWFVLGTYMGVRAADG